MFTHEFTSQYLDNASPVATDKDSFLYDVSKLTEGHKKGILEKTDTVIRELSKGVTVRVASFYDDTRFYTQVTLFVQNGIITGGEYKEGLD